MPLRATAYLVPALSPDLPREDGGVNAMTLQTVAQQLAKAIHEADYSIPDEQLVEQVTRSADLLDVRPEAIIDAVRAELKAHYYH